MIIEPVLHAGVGRGEATADGAPRRCGEPESFHGRSTILSVGGGVVARSLAWPRTSVGATVQYTILPGLNGLDYEAFESEITLRHSFSRLTPILGGRFRRSSATIDDTAFNLDTNALVGGLDIRLTRGWNAGVRIDRHTTTALLEYRFGAMTR